MKLIFPRYSEERRKEEAIVLGQKEYFILICVQHLSSLTAFVATKRNRGA